MFDRKLTIDLSGVGNDIPTRLGKIRPTLTPSWVRNFRPTLTGCIALHILPDRMATISHRFSGLLVLWSRHLAVVASKIMRVTPVR